jgi:hypothetical protein
MKLIFVKTESFSYLSVQFNINQFNISFVDENVDANFCWNMVLIVIDVLQISRIFLNFDCPLCKRVARHCFIGNVFTIRMKSSSAGRK